MLLGYYGFWIFAWLMLGYCLVWAPRPYARVLGRRIQRAHIVSSSWVWLLWMLYPVCWGISEGGNLISPDSEFIFYGLLDCCLIPITCMGFLALHWSIDPFTLGLEIRGFEDTIRANQMPAFASGALQVNNSGTFSHSTHHCGYSYGVEPDSTGNMSSIVS